MEPYQKVGARYYNATYGRFITRDTDLSQSPYAYCNGDPVNNSDPTGHLSIVNIASGGIKASMDSEWTQAEGNASDWSDESSSISSGTTGGGNNKAAAGKQDKGSAVPAFVPLKVTIEAKIEVKGIGITTTNEFDGPKIWGLMSPAARAGIHNTIEFDLYIYKHEIAGA